MRMLRKSTFLEKCREAADGGNTPQITSAHTSAATASMVYLEIARASVSPVLLVIAFKYIDLDQQFNYSGLFIFWGIKAVAKH